MIAVAVQFELGPVMVYRQPRVSIGRRPPRDIVIDDAVIARHHCDLEIDGQQLLLRDASSSGGIFVEGVRISVCPMPRAGVTLGRETLRAWLVEGDEAPPGPDLALALDPAASATELERLAGQSGALLRLVVANPSAPPALLRRMARFPDMMVQRAIAANPSTPREVYLRAAEFFPEEFWKNPQLALLLIEDPTLATISSFTLCSLLASSSAPSPLLRHFQKHPGEAVREFASRALRSRGEPAEP